IGNDRDEVVAGELAHLAGEVHAAIGNQDFGFTDTTRIEDDLTRRGITSVVLVGKTEIEIAERHPHALAAPAHMNDALSIGQELAEDSDRPWRSRAFEARIEGKGAGRDAELLKCVHQRPLSSRP